MRAGLERLWIAQPAGHVGGSVHQESGGQGLPAADVTEVRADAHLIRRARDRMATGAGKLAEDPGPLRGHAAYRWGCALPLPALPGIELCLRLGDGTDQHPGVVCPAELRAGAEV